MNKRYCLISMLSYTTMVLLLIILFYSNNNTYVTMTSIFIPILLGFLINYDSKQKEKYRLYYLLLYHYIKGYYDVISQPPSRLSIPEKYIMINSMCKDILIFLNQNLKYASEEVSDELSILLFYKYENEIEPNEIQDVYNINSLLPSITKELLEYYNMLHIEQYLKKKKYLNKKYHMVNGIIFLYVDSFLIDLARRKKYVLNLDESIVFYTSISNYRDKYPNNYYDIYKYLKRNRNKDISSLIQDLNNKFKINIKKFSKNRINFKKS